MKSVQKTFIFLLILLITGNIFDKFYNTSYASSLPETIYACDDQAEWPPYTYYKRNKNKSAPREIEGFSNDVTNKILKEKNVKVILELLPWERCQQEIFKGIKYVLTYNASFSESRNKNYYMSDAIYKTKSYYYYSKKKHPKGLNIKKLSDIKKYTICGIFGFNYENYGIKKNSHEIDAGAKNFKLLFEKVLKDRCDLFIEKKEVIQGLSVLGETYMNNPNIQGKLLPGVKDTTFHYMISKNWSHGANLLKILNEGLKHMKDNGEIRALLRKYHLD